MHFHRYGLWIDTEVNVIQGGRTVKGLRQIRRCRKCNKLKMRRVYAA